MDYHADELPAGIYEVHISGMDMANLNAWRFFNDGEGAMVNAAMGVDADGVPVPPLRSHSVSGRLYSDLDTTSDEDWRTTMDTNVTGPRNS